MLVGVKTVVRHAMIALWKDHRHTCGIVAHGPEVGHVAIETTSVWRLRVVKSFHPVIAAVVAIAVSVPTLSAPLTIAVAVVRVVVGTIITIVVQLFT